MQLRVTVSAEANYSPGATAHLDTSRNNAKAIFIDDGVKARFIISESTGGNYVELDSVRIYSAPAIAGNISRLFVQIAWSRRGLQALLLVNGEPCALFDFAARRGFCQSAFGMPQGNWRRYHRERAYDLCHLFNE